MPPREVTLRPMTPGDVDAVVAVAARGAAPADVMPPDDDPDPVAWTAARRGRYATFLRSRMEPLADGRREASFLVVVDEAIVGVARLTGHDGGPAPTAYEIGLWLDRASRGHGVGGAVLELLGARARALGGATLVAGTTIDNVAALAVLRRRGAVGPVGPAGEVAARIDLR